MWYNYSLILYILPVLANAGNINADQLLVQTNVGSFRGKHISPSVRSWLGVPFGASTTGKLRFQPPQAAAAQPKGVIFDATKFGLGCPQNKGGAYAASEASFGEPAVGSFAEGDDCLNLIIWSPTTDRLNGSLAAVMVWIYGGGGQYGGSAAPFFDGNNFVRDQGNVVLVSINYRTNIFGSFPRASNQHDFEVNNPGLLDQRLAVEWVHSKIHHFGGNASRIILFGESAGAGAVATWAYAYKDNPLVSRLVM